MEDITLFEEYLENQLSLEEKERFEQRLKNDPVFLSEFENYKTLQLDMQQWYQTESHRLQLKQTIKRITNESNTKAIVKPMRWYLWRAAVVVVILTGLLWWFLTPPGSKSNSELFAEYSAGENISIFRGSNTDSLWEKASSFLYDKKYSETILVLQQIIATGKDSSQEATAYLGYCFMQMNNDSRAEAIFTDTIFKQKEIANRVLWYKALLYLKTGRKDVCVATLTQLQSSGGVYANKAMALLKEKIH